MRLRNKKVLFSYLFLLIVLPFIASKLEKGAGQRMVNRQLSCANKGATECLEVVKKIAALEADLKSRDITLHPNMKPAEMGAVAEVYAKHGIDLKGARNMALALLVVEALLIGTLAALVLGQRYHVDTVAGASAVLGLFGAGDIRVVLLYAAKAALIWVTGVFILWFKKLP